ncbi:hypothetical protein PGT21_023186 [Puccinia graminis f. sp. tritici]|uniref:Uncharacterized protein n=1 Tax=Puccinia graminis f. sp. tritici TaxID=56615 RepID=A0A5B0PFS4_PUCGR|nr:hypothetical protein PGT21_023186 [Puccinia graminis f. sp. tritici]
MYIHSLLARAYKHLTPFKIKLGEDSSTAVATPFLTTHLQRLQEPGHRQLASPKRLNLGRSLCDSDPIAFQRAGRSFDDRIEVNPTGISSSRSLGTPDFQINPAQRAFL